MEPGPGFADRFAKARAVHGPLTFGLDPSGALLREWSLGDSSDGLERFVDIAVEAAAGAVAVVKPQSAFYERHGWQGVRSLARLVAECRDAGLLVLLDAKRGDVGSTNEAYAEAYFGPGAGIPADALTVTPYLGLEAMRSIFDRAAGAGSGVFVVTRSSNPEGRTVQEARVGGGESVEGWMLGAIAAENRRLAPETGTVGPIGAVFGPTHEPPDGLDLAGMNGLFLAPGVGAQGATLADVARCFAACPDRVLPAASRSLLAAGPDVKALRDGLAAAGADARAALG
ncbi:MAG TPA: orotidine-5'-phosphate decarboxylase [Acidimicrobiales bacterium]|nr:orotidine-5'-phosphate decarboxylase [Acidimicrobiales bacterium]